MGAISTVAALFVIAIAAHVSCDELDDVVVMPLVVQYQLLSMHSGKFVGVTTGKSLHAMGDIRDPRTKFVPRFSHDGKISFESYCNPGYYIVFHNTTTMGLGIPSDDNELFEQISPFPEAFAYKSNAFDPQECYLAFDRFGNAHDEHLCIIDSSHMGTLIRYIETVEEIPCTNARLN